MSNPDHGDGRMEVNYEDLRESLAQNMLAALRQFCHNVDESDELNRSVRTSISFPNRKQPSTSAEGKPYDVETRFVLSLFHKLKKKGEPSVLLISEYGLERSVSSPAELATVLLPALEARCQDEGIADDVRLSPAGIIHILSRPRSDLLRKSGRLPCPNCTKWLKGEKGLWWHQQQSHKIEYSQATAVAASYDDSLAIVPFKRRRTAQTVEPSPIVATLKDRVDHDDPFEFCKTGDLLSLKEAVSQGFNPRAQMDRRGATALMWAAGNGQEEIARYLMQECGCDVNQLQRGKRSFSGRTALHWASRNGHIRVVELLLTEYGADIESATIDGTTAFCWASWQGHLEVMKFLAGRSCDVHRKNSFGCNAVLWCAQGNDSDGTCLQWLQKKGCNLRSVNTNNHGVLHKAAQRGHDKICRWFCENVLFTSKEFGQSATAFLKLIGPDTGGCSPSDLAGMEGHSSLAVWLAEQEIRMIENFLSVDTILKAINDADISWLTESRKEYSIENNFEWEKRGGIQRMQAVFSNRLRHIDTKNCDA